MVSFEQFWQLLYEHGSRNYHMNAAYVRWNELTPEQQQQLYERIKCKIEQGKYVDYNPLEAIHDNLPRRVLPRTQTLSYNDYYRTFRTTNPTNGWQMQKGPDGKVFYSKTTLP